MLAIRLGAHVCALPRLFPSVIALALCLSQTAAAQVDPGVRFGALTGGGPIAGLTAAELTAFYYAQGPFEEVDSVTGTLTEGRGLGPRFNMDSCSGCHAFPVTGGSSPYTNPQIDVATKAGGRNTIPSFIALHGPVREARFVRNPDNSPDGGVHDLYVITGRTDAPGCNISQPDFATALRTNNVIFRIPTPLFGTGLIEAIDDAAILANKSANADQKRRLGISGQENRNGNDGTITRFGWKAQNKSLAIFAAEAYNVEQGVTGDLFPNERDTTPGCRFNATPEDHMDTAGATVSGGAGDVPNFALFMRFLAPLAPGPQSASVNNGAAIFNSIGCALCHTPSLQTGVSSSGALSGKAVNLYSDLLVHSMGTALADGVSQGNAGPDEFRTAPLWGVGQRLFLLHDGRTDNVFVAIQAHSSNGSEANQVVQAFNALQLSQKQDLLNFLRSL